MKKITVFMILVSLSVMAYPQNNNDFEGILFCTENISEKDIESYIIIQKYDDNFLIILLDMVRPVNNRVITGNNDEKSGGILLIDQYDLQYLILSRKENNIPYLQFFDLQTDMFIQIYCI